MEKKQISLKVLMIWRVHTNVTQDILVCRYDICSKGLFSSRNFLGLATVALSFLFGN